MNNKSKYSPMLSLWRYVLHGDIGTMWCVKHDCSWCYCDCAGVEYVVIGEEKVLNFIRRYVDET